MLSCICYSLCSVWIETLSAFVACDSELSLHVYFEPIELNRLKGSAFFAVGNIECCGTPLEVELFLFQSISNSAVLLYK